MKKIRFFQIEKAIQDSLLESATNDKRHSVVNGGGDAFFYKDHLNGDDAEIQENVFEDDVGVCASDDSTMSTASDVNNSGPSDLTKLSENGENVRRKNIVVGFQLGQPFQNC